MRNLCSQNGHVHRIACRLVNYQKSSTLPPMAISRSSGRAIGNMTPQPREGAEFAHRGPRVAFDAETAPGVDPEAQWRFSNSDKYRRVGSTSAQRAGLDPNYRPGYGASSARNSGSSFTPKADWDAGFTPRLGMPKTTMPGPTGEMGPPAPAATSVLPSSETPTPIPATPSPGDLSQTARPSPSITAPIGVQNFRQVTGLPAGQSANSTMIAGQNTKPNLAKRTRPPIDPLS